MAGGPDERPQPIPLRLLIYRSVRVKDLCDGEADGQRGCPDANDSPAASGAWCGKFEDTSAPGRYPQCGGMQFTVNRCQHCRLALCIKCN